MKTAHVSRELNATPTLDEVRKRARSLRVHWDLETLRRRRLLAIIRQSRLLEGEMTHDE